MENSFKYGKGKKMKCEIKKLSEIGDIGSMRSKYYKYYVDVKKLDKDECLVFKFQTEEELNKFRRPVEQTIKNYMKRNFDIFTIKFRRLPDEIGFIILKEYAEIKKKKEH